MIYIDVDGVLADFHSHMERLSDAPDLWTNDDVIHKVMDDNYREVFLKARSTPNMDAFRQMYRANPGQVKLLTAYGSFWSDNYRRDIACHNKITWLTRRKFSSSDIILVEKSDDKLDYCQKGDILYDDKWDTIDKWNHAGGIGIWMQNGRQTSGDYNDRSTRYRSPQ